MKETSRWAVIVRVMTAINELARDRMRKAWQPPATSHMDIARVGPGCDEEVGVTVQYQGRAEGSR